MNDQLQGKLVEILTAIQSATKATSDFALDQLPDVIQSYVLYGRISAIVGMIGTALMLAISCWLIRRAYLESKKEISDQSFGVIFIGAWGGGLGGLLFLFMFTACVQEALLVWLAPKVWLLQELAKLVK